VERKQPPLCLRGDSNFRGRARGADEPRQTHGTIFIRPLLLVGRDELASALTRRNIPFAFVTGYGRDALPAAFEEGIVLDKPFAQEHRSRWSGNWFDRGRRRRAIERPTVLIPPPQRP